MPGDSGRLRPHMLLVESTPQAARQTHLDHFLVPEQKAIRPPQTVLLAEDNDDLRYVLECSLEVMGYRVIACANGAIALAQFHANPAVDLLLTDYDMPQLTGLELAREVTTCSPSVPVMFVTGSSLPPEMMQEIWERRWTFLCKPCSMPVLQATLQKLLDTKESVAA